MGVDIFFVISGYLIGGILFTEIEKNKKIEFINFFERRIRRILPPTLPILILCTVAGWFILLPFDYKLFGQSLVSQAVSISNIYFYQTIGYFDNNITSKPLLHTWSLSLEEQFYILFPNIAFNSSKAATKKLKLHSRNFVTCIAIVMLPNNKY